ncbi:WhiB family transcriptional regulator [Streptomyces paludis]|uniref:WhiB family transcriptional regulator n=1 Tax=Streptomyces paludis TaxID=2282738 RepID=A0A345HQU3_9ACTN|nr:WhiB family transcriptional regulator [Streptomyces paludis]AXG79067.1 WhiB family transcriptional regulator [Streptomyces paludis]
MRTDIYSLIQDASQGNWSPLIKTARQIPGKHWAEEAQCDGHDTEMFVPPGDGPYEEPGEVRAKLGVSLNRPLNLCAACPLAVAARCLVDSLQHDEEFGIRAGLLASERSALRSAWQQRVDDDAVSRALGGATAALGKVEREAVVARFAADPSLDPALVARGLGVTHAYLLKLARRHRKRSAPASSSASASGAPASPAADAA